MALCRGTKRNGEPCTISVVGPDGYCWAHSPKNAEQRRRAASRAGRAKPGKELARLKDNVYELIDRVDSGDLPTGKAQRMLEGYRIIAGIVELERKVREQDELIARIEALEERQQQG